MVLPDSIDSQKLEAMAWDKKTSTRSCCHANAQTKPMTINYATGLTFSSCELVASVCVAQHGVGHSWKLLAFLGHARPANCSKVEQSWSKSALFYIGILGHLQSWCRSLRDQIGCAGREAALHHFHDPGWIQTGHFTYPFGRMVYAIGKKSAHTFKMSKSKALRFFGHAKYSSTASTKKRKSDLEPSVTLRAQIEPNSMAKRGCPHPSRTRANFSPQWNLRLPEKNAIFRANPNL
jgi:hypothetical protein